MVDVDVKYLLEIKYVIQFKLSRQMVPMIFNRNSNKKKCLNWPKVNSLEVLAKLYASFGYLLAMLDTNDGSFSNEKYSY